MRVLAVPRSIARSFENKPLTQSNNIRAPSLDRRRPTFGRLQAAVYSTAPRPPIKPLPPTKSRAAPAALLRGAPALEEPHRLAHPRQHGLRGLGARQHPRARGRDRGPQAALLQRERL